ncbi:MAG: TIGR02757 family protein [Chitinivibrionales bacterium]
MKPSLHATLDDIYARFHKPEFMRMDPIEYVRKFKEPRDIEIVGLLASSLAYGQVENIRRNIERVLSVTGNAVSDFVCATSYRDKQKMLKTFKHRFNDGGDIALLFECVKRAFREKGSIQALFAEGMRLGDPDIKNALSEFVKKLNAWAVDIGGETGKSFRHLLPSPSAGSPCKRLNMYLRWMVRKNDGIDLGLWNNLSPAMLIIPVDTHVAAIARRYKMTRRKTADWRMAEEITGELKKISPFDPVKYDFSLCRAGMVSFRNCI